MNNLFCVNHFFRKFPKLSEKSGFLFLFFLKQELHHKVKCIFTLYVKVGFFFSFLQRFLETDNKTNIYICSNNNPLKPIYNNFVIFVSKWIIQQQYTGVKLSGPMQAIVFSFIPTFGQITINCNTHYFHPVYIVLII